MLQFRGFAVSSPAHPSHSGPVCPASLRRLVRRSLALHSDDPGRAHASPSVIQAIKDTLTTVRLHRPDLALVLVPQKRHSVIHWSFFDTAPVLFSYLVVLLGSVPFLFSFPFYINSSSFLTLAFLLFADDVEDKDDKSQGGSNFPG